MGELQGDSDLSEELQEVVTNVVMAFTGEVNFPVLPLQTLSPQDQTVLQNYSMWTKAVNASYGTQV